MKLPLFEQTLKEFVGSKSNWVGGVIIVASTVMALRNEITIEQWMWAIGNGSAILGIKDAIVKVKK